MITFSRIPMAVARATRVTPPKRSGGTWGRNTSLINIRPVASRNSSPTVIILQPYELFDPSSGMGDSLLRQAVADVGGRAAGGALELGLEVGDGLGELALGLLPQRLELHPELVRELGAELVSAPGDPLLLLLPQLLEPAREL